jgi:hypothetical protein
MSSSVIGGGQRRGVGIIVRRKPENGKEEV